MWSESERDGKFILEWIAKGSYNPVTQKKQGDPLYDMSGL